MDTKTSRGNKSGSAEYSGLHGSRPERWEVEVGVPRLILGYLGAHKRGSEATPYTSWSDRKWQTQPMMEVGFTRISCAPLCARNFSGSISCAPSNTGNVPITGEKMRALWVARGWRIRKGSNLSVCLDILILVTKWK